METDKIKCPLCDHIYEDSWELNDSDDEDIECESCGETFHLFVNHSITYETKKCRCESGEHAYKEALYNDVTQETANRWNEEKFMRKSNHVSHRNWWRRCIKCGYKDFFNEMMTSGSDCPWDGMSFRKVTWADYE